MSDTKEKIEDKQEEKDVKEEVQQKQSESPKARKSKVSSKYSLTNP